MRRFDIERAVLAAPLPGPSVAIMLTLCTLIWADEGIIPPGKQPSLSRLAIATGYDRSTVMRHLNQLEPAGWVTRIRPPKWLAQQMHVTTAYAMHIPDGYAQARGNGHLPLGALTGEARRLALEALEARDAEARSAALRDHAAGAAEAGSGARHSPDDQSAEDPGGRRSSAGDDLELWQIAATELVVITGRKISEDQAREVVRLVLEGREVKRPAAYLRRAVRADPGRFLPRSQPPRVSELGPDGRPKGERP